MDAIDLFAGFGGLTLGAEQAGVNVVWAGNHWPTAVRTHARFLTQHVTGHSGVALTEPIRTITTASSHWNLVDGDRYRPLTGRELARAMGFPDTYTWDDDLTVEEVTRGLGNSVCPPVGREVVSAVVEAVA